MKSLWFNSNSAPWFASVGIHVVVATLLLFSHSGTEVLSPLGDAVSSETLTYISVQETNPVIPAPKVARIKPLEKIQEDDVLTAHKKPTASASETSTPSAQVGRTQGSSDANALGTYLFGLRQLIQQSKIYPSLSKKMGETGKVIIILELLKDGTIRDVKIKDTSPFARLNQAALESVAKVEKYKPIPDSISDQRLSVEVPIQFSL